MSPTLNRSAVAVATALACLLLMASPVSANPIHSATITGGSLDLASPPWSIPLGGGGGCLPGTATVAHDEAVSPHTLELTALDFADELPPIGGASFLVQVQRVSSAPGTHGFGTISNMGLAVRIVIRGPITPGSCDITAPVRCTLTTGMLDLNGSFDNAGGGNPGEPEVGDVIALGASPVPLSGTPPPCLPPFSIYTTGTAALSNITIALTS